MAKTPDGGCGRKTEHGHASSAGFPVAGVERPADADRNPEQRTRTNCQQQSELCSITADPWSGSIGIDRGRIGHREPRGFQKETGVCGGAWTGTARQWSTGGKAKLLGISKRENPYLRKMFIHGARAAVLRVKRGGSSLGKWMSGLETRTARKTVIVAAANKLARISWAVLSSGNDHQPLHRAALLSN